MASLDPMKAVCPGPAVDSFEFDSGSALAAAVRALERLVSAVEGGLFLRVSFLGIGRGRSGGEFAGEITAFIEGG